ncbi:MAG TPA: CheR family methyltransferase [Thermoanaerobaculia bacterium]|nr:CheR family methyltransferase [Thermoanaerobaculia bacterium]
MSQVREAQWSQISEVIAESMGLHFPPERWDDLKRGMAGAAQELGVDDAVSADWLLSAPPTQAQLQILASHLTIGETYFFRDNQTLDALRDEILPALIRARRGREQRLRLWSAACCSGEEAYTLAILVHQLLPDLQDWRVTITATDINPRVLRKAVTGTYGEWSFRDAPVWLKQRYFNRTANGRFTIIPDIRKMVTFAHLNLVEDVYPSLATDTNAMDIIFCRNVLMYFTAPHVRRVIGNLHHSLVKGGWLAVSPSEASKALFPQFLTVNFPGAIFFQKSDAANHAEPAPSFLPTTEEPLWPVSSSTDWTTAPIEEEPIAIEAPRSLLDAAEMFYLEGRFAEAVSVLLANSSTQQLSNSVTQQLDEDSLEPAAYPLLARALANLGRLSEALAWCNRWIAGDKVDAAGHYLRAVVLLEQGATEDARASLQRAIYLHPDFVLAHFALGNLARSRGKSGDAEKHFANALHLVRRYQPDELLPESEGLTAGRLAETLTSVTSLGSAL